MFPGLFAPFLLHAIQSTTVPTGSSSPGEPSSPSLLALHSLLGPRPLLHYHHPRPLPQGALPPFLAGAVTVPPVAGVGVVAGSISGRLGCILRKGRTPGVHGYMYEWNGISPSHAGTSLWRMPRSHLGSGVEPPAPRGTLRCHATGCIGGSWRAPSAVLPFPAR